MAGDANTCRSRICCLGQGASLCLAGGAGRAAKGPVAQGLPFTSIPGHAPLGWEGWRSPHRVSEGKSPLGSSARLGWCDAGCPSLWFPPEHLDGRILPG